MSVFIAPLPPRGWRRLLAAVVDRWRFYRFCRSGRWVDVGLYDPDRSTHD